MHIVRFLHIERMRCAHWPSKGQLEEESPFSHPPSTSMAYRLFGVDVPLCKRKAGDLQSCIRSRDGEESRGCCRVLRGSPEASRM